MPVEPPGASSDTTEASRIRREYAARHADQRLTNRYRFTNPGHLFMLQDRERALLALLARHGFTDRLGGARILDVGCGSGGMLLDLLRYGARGDHLHGVDLLPEEIARASHRLPQADLRCADATALPYADGSFDLVCQILVLSTILDPTLRGRVAAEMIRVTRPDGLIVSYDLRWPSPGNRGVRPVHRAELHRLFPEMTIQVRSTTLAPPLGRLLAPRAWWIASLLQALPFLRGHLLAAVRRRAEV